MCPRGLYNLYTRHAYPWPYIWSGKTPKKKEKKTFTGKKSKKPSGEQQRRIPLQDGQNNICHVYSRNHYRITTQSMNMTECLIVGSRHGPRSRPPWSIREMEVESRSGWGIRRAMASDLARSNGPYETWSNKDSGEEAELVMCDGEMKIHP